MLDYNAPVALTLKLKGPALDESQQHIDLFELATTLSEFHEIFNKTYCILTNQERSSRRNRKEFQVITKEISKGSLIFDNELIITGANMVFPMVGLANAYSIWEYASKSFEILKTIYGWLRKDISPNISVTNSTNSPIINGNNNLVIIGNSDIQVTDPRLLVLAARTRPNYDRITQILNQNGISNFEAASLVNQHDTSIVMDFSDKGLFKNKSIIAKEPIKFYAKVYDFNTERNTGKLRVLNNNFIATDDYPFSIIGDQNIHNYADALKLPYVTVTALQENILDPVQGLKVVRYQVISVEFPIAG